MLSTIQIDRENDLAYISLRPDDPGMRERVSKSARIADDLVLDFDRKGQLIGIELLNASARLNLDAVEGNTKDLIVGVKEAAELAGVEKSNFVRDYANKPGFPKAVVELASGRLWLRTDVEAFLRSKQANVRPEFLPARKKEENPVTSKRDTDDPMALAVRAHDMHHGLIRRQSGLINRYMKKTKIIGTAAQLCTVIKDFQVIDYSQLEVAVGEIGIDDFVLDRALHELEELDFVRLKTAGGEIQRVDVTVPLLRQIYQDLGEKWLASKPTDEENVSIRLLDDLTLVPTKIRTIQKKYNLNADTLGIIRDIGTAAGYLGTYRSKKDGEEVMYSPLHWDEHPQHIDLLTQKHAAEDILQALKQVREHQGLPADHVRETVLKDAVATGLLPTPSVDSMRGKKLFLFTPRSGSLKLYEKSILEKARAIIASVRYGEVFGTITQIRDPLLLLTRLRERKRIGYHTEILRQYETLRNLGVGRISKLTGTTRYMFHLIDNDENLSAVDLAIKMLQIGEPHVDAKDVQSARQLLLPGMYLNPTGTRAAFTSVEPVAYSSATLEHVNELIRGASGEI